MMMKQIFWRDVEGNIYLTDEIHTLLVNILVLFLFFSLLATILTTPTSPRLIGIGCEGAGGDIWAMEESDFPTQCEHIERYK